MWLNESGVVENGRLLELAVAFHGKYAKARQQHKSETALTEDCHPGRRSDVLRTYSIRMRCNRAVYGCGRSREMIFEAAGMTLNA